MTNTAMKMTKLATEAEMAQQEKNKKDQAVFVVVFITYKYIFKKNNN